MPRLSVCYILKNEAEYIERSLLSISELADEILLRDHHSTDGTLDRVRGLNLKQLKIFEADWQNDFSLARNELAKEASGDWVFFLDGDEVVEKTHLPLLKEALQSSASAFSVIQRNYTRDASLADLQRGPEGLLYFENWMERLYRPKSGIHYEGRIHESLWPSARRLGHKIEKLNLVLHHYGRLKAGHSRKLDYYRELTQKKLCRMGGMAFDFG